MSRQQARQPLSQMQALQTQLAHRIQFQNPRTPESYLDYPPPRTADQSKALPHESSYQHVASQRFLEKRLWKCARTHRHGVPRNFQVLPKRTPELLSLTGSRSFPVGSPLVPTDPPTTEQHSHLPLAKSNNTDSGKLISSLPNWSYPFPTTNGATPGQFHDTIRLQMR